MFCKKALFLLAVAAFLALPGHASAQYYYYSDYSYSYFPTESGMLVVPEAPRAQRDPRIDPHLVKAARIADSHAFPHSHARCWQFVKNALLEAGAIASRPSTNYACEAGSELTSRFGFVRLSIHDPYRAPVGALLVYKGGNAGAGHVEFRTENGFASDYHSHWACRYRLIGVYAKLSV